MENLLPDHDIREPNSSALIAIFRVLQRQPWKTFAAQTWDTAKRFLLLTVLATSLAALLPPAIAYARDYDAFSVDVPFKFNIGNRAFRPGHYQFVFVGPGLLALRDSHAHIIASVVARSRETGAPSPISRLVFSKQKNHSHLTQIWLENRSQVLDVLGEELAIRPPAPPPAPLPPEVNSLLDRRTSPGLKY